MRQTSKVANGGRDGLMIVKGTLGLVFLHVSRLHLRLHCIIGADTLDQGSAISDCIVCSSSSVQGGLLAALLIVFLVGKEYDKQLRHFGRISC